MHRTTVVLLQPTVRQTQELETLLEAQCHLYNASLEERRGAWRWEARRIRLFDQQKQLTGWDHPVLRFGVWPARGTLTRLDRAFQGFFRRVRAGQKPGFPRFKSAARWDSVEYPDAFCWKITGSGRTGQAVPEGGGSYRLSELQAGGAGGPQDPGGQAGGKAVAGLRGLPGRGPRAPAGHRQIFGDRPRGHAPGGHLRRPAGGQRPLHPPEPGAPGRRSAPGGWSASGLGPAPQGGPAGGGDPAPHRPPAPRRPPQPVSVPGRWTTTT